MSNYFKEKFLHYIWQHQLFDKEGITTQNNEEILVIHPGYYNTNAGPDFLQAKIKIDNIEWNGAVEVHYKSSDWLLHKHHENQAYENVILHLVWENDIEILYQNGQVIPVIALKFRIPYQFVYQFENLIKTQAFIPCENLIQNVPNIVIKKTMERAMMNRFENKSEIVLARYQQNQSNWEETAYQTIAFAFGLKINADTFLRLATALPIKYLLKHRDNLLQLEALLFGVAGFLTSPPEDEYSAKLQTEYQFLKHKYQLNNELHVSEWKFLRLRPVAFPTVRLAQFGALVHTIPNFFNLISLLEAPEKFLKKWTITQSDYWQNHYQLGVKANSKIGKVGNDMLFSIVINAIVPLVFAQAQENEQYELKENCFYLLEKLKPEKNSILAHWEQMGVKASNAADSQALLELYKNQCSQKQCLQCSIGNHIMKTSKNE